MDCDIVYENGIFSNKKSNASNDIVYLTHTTDFNAYNSIKHTKEMYGGDTNCAAHFIRFGYSLTNVLPVEKEVVMIFKWRGPSMKCKMNDHNDYKTTDMFSTVYTESNKLFDCSSSEHKLEPYWESRIYPGSTKYLELICTYDLLEKRFVTIEPLNISIVKHSECTMSR